MRKRRIKIVEHESRQLAPRGLWGDWCASIVGEMRRALALSVFSLRLISVLIYPLRVYPRPILAEMRPLRREGQNLLPQGVLALMESHTVTIGQMTHHFEGQQIGAIHHVSGTSCAETLH